MKEMERSGDKYSPDTTACVQQPSNKAASTLCREEGLEAKHRILVHALQPQKARMEKEAHLTLWALFRITWKWKQSLDTYALLAGQDGVSYVDSISMKAPGTSAKTNLSLG
jgi:hypothetical protein